MKSIRGETPHTSQPPDRKNQTATGFRQVFLGLRSILKPYSKRGIVALDTESAYYVNMPFNLKNKRQLFFAGVKIGKRYVSYHLMPVYACPELLKGMSPQLKKRMQGKACFNFTEVDQTLFGELEVLTKSGFGKFTDVTFLHALLAMQKRGVE